MAQCTATANSTRAQCERDAIRGGTVCYTHGGRAPQVRAKAAERVALERAEGLLARHGIDPVGDPYTKLLEVAGRFDALAKALEGKVNELKDVRYSTKAGEQLRGEISAYTTVLDRLRATLTDIGRLDIESRLVRLEEAKVVIVVAALDAALNAAGLSGAQEYQLRQAFAAALGVSGG